MRIDGSINLTKCPRDWRENCSNHFSVAAFASASALADAYARYQRLEERKCMISPYLDAGRLYNVTYDQRPTPYEVALLPISNLSPSRTSSSLVDIRQEGDKSSEENFPKRPRDWREHYISPSFRGVLHFPSARPRSHSMPLNSRKPKPTTSSYVGAGRHPSITYDLRIPPPLLFPQIALYELALLPHLVSHSRTPFPLAHTNPCQLTQRNHDMIILALL
ncbi:hypothetical protein BDQ17DRAFT_1376243, partial [Cyathus striatus]